MPKICQGFYLLNHKLEKLQEKEQAPVKVFWHLKTRAVGIDIPVLELLHWTFEARMPLDPFDQEASLSLINEFYLIWSFITESKRINYKFGTWGFKLTNSQPRKLSIPTKMIDHTLQPSKFRKKRESRINLRVYSGESKIHPRVKCSIFMYKDSILVLDSYTRQVAGGSLYFKVSDRNNIEF